jgi:hypothetical protein
MRTLLRKIIVTLARWISPLVQWASIQWEWWLSSSVVHPYRTWSQHMVLELRRQRAGDDGGLAKTPACAPSATSRLNAWTQVHAVSEEQTAREVHRHEVEAWAQ